MSIFGARKRKILVARVLIVVAIVTGFLILRQTGRSGSDLATQATGDLIATSPGPENIQRWFRDNVSRKAKDAAFRADYIKVFAERFPRLVISGSPLSPEASAAIAKESFVRLRFTVSDVAMCFSNLEAAISRESKSLDSSDIDRLIGVVQETANFAPHDADPAWLVRSIEPTLKACHTASLSNRDVEQSVKLQAVARTPQTDIACAKAIAVWPEVDARAAADAWRRLGLVESQPAVVMRGEVLRAEELDFEAMLQAVRTLHEAEVAAGRKNAAEQFIYERAAIQVRKALADERVVEPATLDRIAALLSHVDLSIMGSRSDELVSLRGNSASRVLALAADDAIAVDGVAREIRLQAFLNQSPDEVSGQWIAIKARNAWIKKVLAGSDQLSFPSDPNRETSFRAAFLLRALEAIAARPNNLSPEDLALLESVLRREPIDTSSDRFRTLIKTLSDQLARGVGSGDSETRHAMQRFLLNGGIARSVTPPPVLVAPMLATAVRDDNRAAVNGLAAWLSSSGRLEDSSFASSVAEEIAGSIERRDRPSSELEVSLRSIYNAIGQSGSRFATVVERAILSRVLAGADSDRLEDWVTFATRIQLDVTDQTAVIGAGRVSVQQLAVSLIPKLPENGRASSAEMSRNRNRLDVLWRGSPDRERADLHPFFVNFAGAAMAAGNGPVVVRLVKDYSNPAMAPGASGSSLNRLLEATLQQKIADGLVASEFDANFRTGSVVETITSERLGRLFPDNMDSRVEVLLRKLANASAVDATELVGLLKRCSQFPVTKEVLFAAWSRVVENSPQGHSELKSRIASAKSVIARSERPLVSVIVAERYLLHAYANRDWVDSERWIDQIGTHKTGAELEEALASCRNALETLELARSWMPRSDRQMIDNGILVLSEWNTVRSMQFLVIGPEDRGGNTFDAKFGIAYANNAGRTELRGKAIVGISPEGMSVDLNPGAAEGGKAVTLIRPQDGRDQFPARWAHAFPAGTMVWSEQQVVNRQSAEVWFIQLPRNASWVGPHRLSQPTASNLAFPGDKVSSVAVECPARQQLSIDVSDLTKNGPVTFTTVLSMNKGAQQSMRVSRSKYLLEADWAVLETSSKVVLANGKIGAESAMNHVSVKIPQGTSMISFKVSGYDPKSNRHSHPTFLICPILMSAD